jgi:hypothetical protein
VNCQSLNSSWISTYHNIVDTVRYGIWQCLVDMCDLFFLGSLKPPPSVSTYVCTYIYRTTLLTERPRAGGISLEERESALFFLPNAPTQRSSLSLAFTKHQPWRPKNPKHRPRWQSAQVAKSSIKSPTRRPNPRAATAIVPPRYRPRPWLSRRPPTRLTTSRRRRHPTDQ